MAYDKNETRQVNIHNEAAAPTVSDDADAGYLCGDMWIDKTDASSANWVIHQLVDCTPGAAVWKQISN